MSSSHHDIEKATIAHSDGRPEEKPFHQHTNGGLITPPPRASTLSNPGPLGVFSFASTTFILSMYNAHVRDITTPNVVIGMAIFCGGLAQLLAGMWEFPRGNTFAATAFSSYGGFWMSFATIHIPGSGILDAYRNSTNPDPHQQASAVGIYLTAWMLITLFFLIAALRKSIAFIVLFGLLFITFLLLAAGDFSGVGNVGRAGGYTGILTAFVAYYIGLSELLAAEKKSVIRLPLGLL